MVKNEILGYTSFKEYKEGFFETLKSTNQTFSYFVDWEKIRSKARDIEEEIMLMQILSKKEKENRRQKLRELLEEYPRVSKVIPLIIAVRNKKLEVMDVETLEISNYDFSPKSRTKKSELVYFCEESGILDLFDEIDSLYDYIFGVEVGLDTNARKNRSGKIFEKIIGEVLDDQIPNSSYSFTSQETIKLKRRKKADFEIKKNNETIAVVECNFYSGTGSKPIETARSYIELERKLKKKGISFIWVTDGFGWKKMKNPILDSMRNMDYVLNLEMFRKIF